MKRKILSILLIIFILSASLITIPVNAKILNDVDEPDWVNSLDDIWTTGDAGETAIYATLDDYLNVHYVNYANLNKNQITTLYINLSDFANFNYTIQDLSGLYEFTNLLNLVITWPDDITQAAIDELDFSRFINLEGLKLLGVDITNLEISELTEMKYLDIYVDDSIYTSTSDCYINMDLSKLDELTYFNYEMGLNYKMEDWEWAEFLDEVTSKIKTPENYDVWGHIEDSTSTQTGQTAVYISLIEALEMRVGTDKINYTFNEQVKCYVSWSRRTESSEFIVHFDPTKLELVSADIGEDFYNTDFINDGEISVAWIALDELGIDTITFNFNIIGEGNAEIYARPYEFATGDLDNTFAYKDSLVQTITLESDYIKDNATIQTDLTNIDGEDFDLLSGLALKENKVTLQDLIDLNAFDDGITVKVYNNDGAAISATEGLGTGSKIKLYKGQEVVRELDVIVYGDVTGDGEITALDALTIIKVKNNKIPYDSVSTICKAAGQVFTGHQDVHGPSAIDALAIIKHLNGKYEISQNY